MNHEERQQPEIVAFFNTQYPIPLLWIDFARSGCWVRGVAEAWLAFNASPPRTGCRFKILRPNASDQGLLRRFRREAEIITGLKSPYIVKMYGLEEEETPILVMEYVPGADLKILLQLDGVRDGANLRLYG